MYSTRTIVSDRISFVYCSRWRFLRLADWPSSRRLAYRRPDLTKISSVARNSCGLVRTGVLWALEAAKCLPRSEPPSPISADESACTPGSVPGCLTAIPMGDHPSGPAVAGRLVRSTRRLGRAALKRLRRSLHLSGADPFDLAPGGVYLAVPVTRDAGGLLHHRFTLTERPKPPGGLFSVALSRGSPRVAVSNHPALWSPDVPRSRCRDRDRPADSSVVDDILVASGLQQRR